MEEEIKNKKSLLQFWEEQMNIPQLQVIIFLENLHPIIT
jgi:hypothetical protein